ncbi:MAG TPA: C-GCAxxG-C-C family protein [Desulfatiglandales bacterium]
MLAGFGELYGLDRPTAFKLARAFGSGMGMGRECGAVTGALMILGLKVQEATSEKETRYRVYDLVKEFVRLFEEKRGTILCKDLLGVDLGTPEAREKAIKDNLFRTLCPGFVRDAAQILTDMKP